jgi:hypothetical protein
MEIIAFNNAKIKTGKVLYMSIDVNPCKLLMIPNRT